MITQVTTCKGRRELVEKHITRWLDSGVDELVLVDYACPEHTGKALLRTSAGNDPRVTIVQVPEFVVHPSKKMIHIAGSTFNLCRARNIGILAARHDYTFMLDADCWVTPSFIEDVKARLSPEDEEPAADLLVAGHHVFRQDGSSQLPCTWVKDGQCVVRTSMLHAVHGYNEIHNDWGGESYDLYLRLKAHFPSAHVDNFASPLLQATPHDDQSRFQYYEPAPNTTRETHYKQSSKFLADQRSCHTRSMPGRMMGPAEKLQRYLILHRGGVQRPWRPGEDDLQ